MFLNVRHNSFQTKGGLVRTVDQNGGNLNVLYETFQSKRLPKSCKKLGENQEYVPKTAISGLLSGKNATKESQQGE